MTSLINQFKQLWQSNSRVALILTVVIALLIGYTLAPDNNPVSPEQHKHSNTAEVWTCSMHPQIQQPGPGACPICGMDLIPISNDQSSESGPRELQLSANARKLAGIVTAKVERRFVNKEIRLAGKIAVDETRLSYIPAYTGGRIERLYVNYTGTTVRRGDHLAQIYSPELLTAQEELLQAIRLADKASSSMLGNAQLSLDATRDKLRLSGLTKAQISAVEKSGKISERLNLYSPVSGVVIDRNATEGSYVQTGTRIFTLANLSKVWLLLDAYETDLPWLRYGQKVEFETAALPGEIFSGQIIFIDPILDAKTRTVKVRVNVDNPGQLLKPEMFVRAVVSASVSESGKTADPALAGKWISPMHPEIIKDQPGQCDVCGMDLVRIENLGYVPIASDSAPIIIPATAPLLTGKRAVVYIALGDGRFEGREITLGPRAGDTFIVREGLEVGESVVVNGAFKLDSDLQIRAKPSMMSPIENQDEHSGHQHSAEQTVTFTILPEFQQQLDQLFLAYSSLHLALSKDSLSATFHAAGQLQTSAEKVNMALLQGEAHQKWMSLSVEINLSIKQLQNSDNLADARIAFEPLSDALYQTGNSFALKMENPLRRFYCPMAFDNRGAYWLQDHPGVENPYFGAAMYRCGEEVEVLGGSTK